LYDFTNLSDVEFEKLCGDVLSRKLGMKLRYFAPGRDGGIDLVDDVENKNVVVQVKHYAKSSYSSLLASLKKEVPKVKKLNPKQYYICVSQQLTAPNVKEIYDLFDGYMEDTSNIITRDILVEFLDEDSNQDILRKNFKLWLLSDKLLKEIFNNQVFIDSEVLLDDIDEDFNYFVQTKVFNEALEILKNYRLLMLHGAPGVGKSINSKMLAASFVKEDYIIRYTTDGQVSNIKNVISENPDVKEVILLDDCLGQYYFNLKEGQDRELISLIKYVKQYENKVIILNTRVTVLNEAKRSRFEFRRYLERDKIPLRTIDMDDISAEEKAEIFYNHLSKNKIPKDYYNTLKEGKRYKVVINHKNYNPRIIEYVTEEHRYKTVKAKDYYKYILKNLDHPNDVWADEFEHKLEEIDRIFMYTLFSLTDTHIDIDVLEECFIYRLDKEDRSQSTINYFFVVTSRLGKSLIRTFDDNGLRKIGVLNPSINDYMNNHIYSNRIGLKAIRNSILYIEQLEKMYGEKEAEEILIEKLNSGEFINFKSIDNKKISYLFYGIAEHKILNESYKKVIKDNFDELNESITFFNKKLEKKDLVIKFLEEKTLYEFYEIEESLKDPDFVECFISNIDFKGLSAVLSVIKKEELSIPGLSEEILLPLFEELEYYIDEFEIYDYIEALHEADFFSDLMYLRFGEEIDAEKEEEFDREIALISTTVQSDIIENIKNQLDKALDFQLIQEKIEKMVKINISEEKILDILDTHFFPEPDYDEDYREESRGFEVGDRDEIDIIFDREYQQLDE